jgi:hypothetical protein
MFGQHFLYRGLSGLAMSAPGGAEFEESITGQCTNLLQSWCFFCIIRVKTCGNSVHASFFPRIEWRVSKSLAAPCYASPRRLPIIAAEGKDMEQKKTATG